MRRKGSRSGEVPTHLDAPCPSCGETARHRVLSGSVRRDGTVDCTAQCQSCGRVGGLTAAAQRPREICAIVSSGGESERVRTVLPDGVYAVGDEVMVLDRLCEITALEGKAVRMESCALEDISTIWAKDITEITLKISINVGRETKVAHYPVTPDYELAVGDILDTSIGLVRVHAIKNREKLISHGGAFAKDIVRAYARPARTAEPPKPTEEEGGRPRGDHQRTGRAFALSKRNEPGRKERQQPWRKGKPANRRTNRAGF